MRTALLWQRDPSLSAAQLRDRLRARGVPVIGPKDHGFCMSIYFAGPENLSLELSCSSEPINADAWIDPDKTKVGYEIPFNRHFYVFEPPRPLEEIDAAEIYVPFSWFEPMWLENLGFVAEGEGWKLTESGDTEIGGRIPLNASGGVLSSNPIGASGMIRFAESAIQVMGKAGDHQVADARKALGHAYGGGAQYYSMWLVGADKPTN